MCIAVVAAYFALSNGLLQPGLTTHAKPLAELFSNQANRTPYGMLSADVTGVHSVDGLNVTYSGFMNVSIYDISLGSLQLHIPVRAGYASYHGSSRMYLNMAVPQAGINVEFMGADLSNGTSYSCNRYSVMSGNQTSTFNCTKSINKGQEVVGLGGLVSNLAGRVNGTASVIGTREYNGENCTLVSMNGTLDSSAMTANSFFGQVVYSFFGTGRASYDYNVTACLSDRYYAPLNVTAELVPYVANESIGIFVKLGAVSMSRNAGGSYVNAAPPENVSAGVVHGG